MSENSHEYIDPIASYTDSERERLMKIIWAIRSAPFTEPENLPQDLRTLETIAQDVYPESIFIGLDEENFSQKSYADKLRGLIDGINRQLLPVSQEQKPLQRNTTYFIYEAIRDKLQDELDKIKT